VAALGLKPDGGRPTSPARPTSATVEGYGREENAVAAAAAVALATAVDAALDAASAGSFSPLSPKYQICESTVPLVLS
jgi:hypothetical protein